RHWRFSSAIAPNAGDSLPRPSASRCRCRSPHSTSRAATRGCGRGPLLRAIRWTAGSAPSAACGCGTNAAARPTRSTSRAGPSTPHWTCAMQCTSGHAAAWAAWRFRNTHAGSTGSPADAASRRAPSRFAIHHRGRHRASGRPAAGHAPCCDGVQGTNRRQQLVEAGGQGCQVHLARQGVYARIMRFRYAALQHPAGRPMLLYQYHELMRAWMAPVTFWAEAGARAYSAPASWLSALPGAQRVAAGYELLYRLGKDYEKPEFGIHSVESNGRTYPVVEREVLATPFCRLLRFKRFADDADGIRELKD